MFIVYIYGTLLYLAEYSTYLHIFIRQRKSRNENNIRIPVLDVGGLNFDIGNIYE